MTSLKLITVSVITASALMLSGCAGMNRNQNTAVGAGVGAVAGGALGGTAGAVGGAVVGGVIGRETPPRR